MAAERPVRTYLLLVAVICVVVERSGWAQVREAAGTSPQPGARAQDSKRQLPLFSQYIRRIRELMRRESTAKTLLERAVVVQEMCGLFREIVQDPRYVTSPTLQEYRGLLAARLRRICDDLEREMARHRDTRPTALHDGQSTALHQTDQQLASQLADTWELASQTVGGPAVLFGSTGWNWVQEGHGGGAAVWDYGPALVELIQRTIVPKFWDVNGGPGTIVYYRPAMVLVVRATPGMHLEVADGLRRLRGR